MVFHNGKPFKFDDSTFSNSTLTPEFVDNIHMKEVNSTNFSFLEQKSVINSAGPIDNDGVEKENSEDAGTT